MEWINFEKEKPPQIGRYLVAKVYLDAPYGEDGYEHHKAFWTEPFVMVDHWLINSWQRGGKALYWMPIPEIPKESYDSRTI